MIRSANIVELFDVLLTHLQLLLFTPTLFMGITMFW